MKRITLFNTKAIIILLISSWVENISATTYYISNGGDDGATGTSALTAWATISKVNSQSLSPGDSVLFKAGNVWRDMLDITESGTPDNFIVYSRYGDGDNPRILASEKATNWTETGTPNIWQSSGTFSDPRGARPSELFFVTDDSTTWGDFQNYTGGFTGLTREFDWTYNASTVYCYAPTDPDLWYDDVEVPQRDQAVQMLDQNPENYIEINGIDMLYGKSKGFYGGYPASNARGLVFRNCRVAYIGQKGGASCYGIATFHSDFLAENCLITDCGRRGISFNLYTVADVEDRRVISNVIVRNNVFKRGYHTTSLDLASLGDRETAPRPDTISGVYFYNNIVDDSEITMTGEDEASNQIFTQQGGIIMKNIYIINNIFVAATARNILIERGDSIFIWNNTIIGHNQNDIPSPYANISFNYSTNNDLRNNIIYQNLPDNSLANYGVLMEHDVSNYIAKDYNLHYQEVENSNRGFNGGVYGYYNISNWSSYRSSNPTFDANSPEPGDPSFIDLIGKNFGLAPTSPAIAAGTPLSIIITDPNKDVDTIGKYDFTGILRNPVNPTIGAIESLPDSAATDIINFILPLQTGPAAINKTDHTVSVEVPYGTNITNLSPTIAILGKTIDPASGVARDFSTPKVYTVTALNGTSQQDWTVTVTTAQPSTETDILNFTLAEQSSVASINPTNHTIQIEVDFGANLASLSPTITLSEGASINPASGVARNFSAPLNYTVTAQDGTTKQDWTVTVNTNNPPEVSLSFESNIAKGFVYSIDANETSDPDGDDLSFIWDVPEEFSSSSLNGESIFILPSEDCEEGEYVINLSVSDGKTSVNKTITLNISNYRPLIQELTVSSVQASDYETGNEAEKAIDNDIETRWSADGDNHWLTFELENEAQISHIGLIFYRGDVRNSFFEAYASKDNTNWDLILENSKSCGFSLNFQFFEIPEKSATEPYKYIRLLGHMNSENSWNSYNEFKAFGNTVTDVEITQHGEIELYPNPARDVFYIKLVKESTIRIIDLTGNFVYEKFKANNVTKIDYDLPKGIYIIQVINDKTSYSKEIVIQ